jgi:hypothetical protein
MGALRIALIAFGIVFCSIYGLFQIDLFGGWAWAPAQPEYQLMIVGIYLVLGLMMIFQASKSPLEHILFIRFVIISSLVHGLIMLYQAYIDPAERGHFFGDIRALIIAALVLEILLRKELLATATAKAQKVGETTFINSSAGVTSTISKVGSTKFVNKGS